MSGLNDLPWLDRPDAHERVDAKLAAGEVTEAQAEVLRAWISKGYCVIEGLLDADTASEINRHVDDFLEEQKDVPRDELIRKLENRFVHCEAIERALCLASVYEWADLLLGKKVVPYQTLSLPRSSEQGAHSDEILMTTRPRGYLIAAWFALEDIPPDSGPLFVYGGSHRWDYVSADELGIPRGGRPRAECDEAFNASYYEAVQKRIDAHDTEPTLFLPKLGDVLFWHSNLLHGAIPVERAGATRRSLIAHYFGEGAEIYSDVYDRPCEMPYDLRP